MHVSEVYPVIYNILSINFSIPTNTKGITYETLAEFIAKDISVRSGGLGFTSAGGINGFINKIFPNKPKFWTLQKYLLSTLELKRCAKCLCIHEYNHFHSNTRNTDKFSQYCKDCDRLAQRKIAPARQAIRRARVLKAIPAWEQKEAIREFYRKCPVGYHVDHIIPLSNDIVCGLHCVKNLQYLTAEDNLKKSNTFNVDTFVGP